MSWFWAVLFALSAGLLSASFVNGRRQARRIGELESTKGQDDAIIRTLRSALDRAGGADPTLDDILGLFNEEPDA